MQLLMTFGETRRSRRRQAFWGTALWVGIALLVGLGALASYQIGVSQSRIEVARLQSDLAALQELNRLLSERAANAEQRAEASIMKQARLQQAYNSEVPRGDLRDLTALLERRLKDGVPADRLAFLLREAEVSRRCDPQTDSKKLIVHTMAATGSAASAAFASNKITVTAEGAPIRKADGHTEAAFDPGQSISLRFLKIGRDMAKVEGPLPLSHATVLGDREYLFTVKALDKNPGQVEIVTQSCAYP